MYHFVYSFITQHMQLGLFLSTYVSWKQVFE